MRTPNKPQKLPSKDILKKHFSTAMTSIKGAWSWQFESFFVIYKYYMYLEIDGNLKVAVY